ncbi:hypothetical protein B0H13DRAFT_1852153 [Mycena leptocephala]|nr:hypothetical protein B0H13DRAFT_1852153 [Mycena leptocephala]
MSDRKLPNAVARKKKKTHEEAEDRAQSVVRLQVALRGSSLSPFASDDPEHLQPPDLDTRTASPSDGDDPGPICDSLGHHTRSKMKRKSDTFSDADVAAKPTKKKPGPKPKPKPKADAKAKASLDDDTSEDEPPPPPKTKTKKKRAPKATAKPTAKSVYCNCFYDSKPAFNRVLDKTKGVTSDSEDVDVVVAKKKLDAGPIGISYLYHKFTANTGSRYGLYDS